MWDFERVCCVSFFLSFTFEFAISFGWEKYMNFKNAISRMVACTVKGIFEIQIREWKPFHCGERTKSSPQSMQIHRQKLGHRKVLFVCHLNVIRDCIPHTQHRTHGFPERVFFFFHSIDWLVDSFYSFHIRRDVVKFDETFCKARIFPPTMPSTSTTSDFQVASSIA